METQLKATCINKGAFIAQPGSSWQKKTCWLWLKSVQLVCLIGYKPASGSKWGYPRLHLFIYLPLIMQMGPIGNRQPREEGCCYPSPSLPRVGEGMAGAKHAGIPFPQC